LKAQDTKNKGLEEQLLEAQIGLRREDMITTLLEMRKSKTAESNIQA
jgi:hypothetical protein